MEWSQEQQAALADVGTWLARRHGTEEGAKQVFRVFGYAGTGKTTLARHFAESINGRVLFGAFTGKAALVLRQKGCPYASTLHKLIYVPKDKSRARLLEMETLAGELVARGENSGERWEELQLDIRREKDGLKRPSFALNTESEVRGAALVVVDEVSMVGARIGEDLLSFQAPILVLGDPAQLPPVADGGYFTLDAPDVLLTEVHRQARGSPVLEMATEIREGRTVGFGQRGESAVVKRGSLTMRQVAEFDQVLVGRNATRKLVNRRIRTEVLGRASHLPEEGDKLVCLRNNHELGLLNGGQWDVVDCQIVDDGKLALELRSPGDGFELTCLAHRAHFEDTEIPYWERNDAEEFDFGYAMTCHKAQGSQWDRVLVVDESSCFREQARRWLYTAVTRAAKAVTVVV